MDCQERGLREEDWNDPIDSREEGTQKYATTTSAANARIAAMHSASVTASVSAVPSSVKKSVKSTATSASSLIAKAASDFGSGMSSTQKINSNSKGKGKAVEVPAVDASLEMKKTDDELRKTILNAPRRISKIESSIAKHEVEIKKIDEEMIVVSGWLVCCFNTSLSPHGECCQATLTSRIIECRKDSHLFTYAKCILCQSPTQTLLSFDLYSYSLPL